MELKFTSSVKPETVRKALVRGSWISALGALILLLTGVLLPISLMKIWGIPAFFSALFFIALGLIPHRLLKRLEEDPYQLLYDGAKLTLKRKRRVLFAIDQARIETLEYVENDSIYGIGITLKRPYPQDMNPSFLAVSRQQFSGIDIFCPYFSKRSAEELKEQLL